MGRPKVEKPLVTKIAEAFKAVEKLKRSGRNTKHNYDFTRASDVFEAVRLKLFDAGVLCCPSEAAPEYVQVGPTNGGEMLTECRLSVTYVFQDAAQKLEPMTFNGVGRDVEDKALYKAQTGAQKALFKRFGIMAEEQDDPEFESEETIDDAAPMRVPRHQQPIRDFEVNSFQEACAASAKTAAEVGYYLRTEFETESIVELKRRDFKAAIRWASNGAGTLAPKPQAAPALQGNLPLPKPAPSFEMRVAGKTHVIEPRTGSYSV